VQEAATIFWRSGVVPKLEGEEKRIFDAVVKPERVRSNGDASAEIERLRGEIARAETMLANERFVQNAKPEVVEAVAGRCEIYVDGGIRRGTDVLKALALGARATLIGRAVASGLAVGGEAGVLDVLTMLHDEIELGLALLGCTSPDEVTRSHVEPTVPYDPVA